MSETIETEVTKLLGIKYPIILAGMNGVSHAELAAAVTNAGGLGTIGGLSLTPKMLRQNLQELKAKLADKNAPFGVDLALPQIGGSARKTNHDYTKGKLPELVDIMIEEKTRIFICAVGVPPKWVVDKLHANGIICANMVGAPHHAIKAIEAGMDMVIAQGTEGGGHTGEIGTMVLIRQCIEACKGHTSKLTGKPIYVIAAGGICDGESLAASFALGAQAAWVGTRFVACKESAAPERHKNMVVKAEALDTLRTLVVSGRPLRTYRTEYIAKWEERPEEIRSLCAKGIVPMEKDLRDAQKDPNTTLSLASVFPLLMGQCAGSIKSVLSAEEIIHEMMTGAIAVMKQNNKLIVSTNQQSRSSTTARL